MDLPERTRIQPSLTPRQMELLLAIRARKGWSVSVAVGEAVEAYAQELGLVDPERPNPPKEDSKCFP